MGQSGQTVTSQRSCGSGQGEPNQFMKHKPVFFPACCVPMRSVDDTDQPYSSSTNRKASRFVGEARNHLIRAQREYCDCALDRFGERTRPVVGRVCSVRGYLSAKIEDRSILGGQAMDKEGDFSRNLLRCRPLVAIRVKIYGLQINRLALDYRVGFA